MKLKYNFLIQEVAGTYMAVAIGEGAENFKGMIKMNGTAKRVFELIQQGLSEKDVVATMLEEYEASESDIQKSVDTMVNQLNSQKLIVD